MNLREIVEKLPCKLICGAEHLDREVAGAYVSDLLSDVMGHASEGQIWLTLQAHRNVVAIASLKELAGVIFVKGIIPENDEIQKAIDEDVVLISTELGTFEAGGKLYNILHSENA